MGMRLYPDQSTKNCARAIVERVFVKEITGGMRRNMVLQSARIEFLLMFRDSDSQQIAATAFADESAETFETRISRTKIQVQTHRRCIVIDQCGVHLQRDDVLRPILGTHISHFRARTGDEVVDPTGKARGSPITGTEMFDHCDLRELISD